MQSTHDQHEPKVSALMRGLVHELRNPLSAIITATNLLTTSGAMDEETVMLLEVVHKESHRMNQILTEFSTYVKPPRARPDQLDLGVLVRRVLRETLGDAAASGPDANSAVSLAVRLVDELPPHLEANADLQCTERALVKVLHNAREAIPEGGTIRVSGDTDGHDTWIAIENSGEKPSQEIAERAFEPFFTTKSGAVGLGLAIARSVLASSHGKISLEPTQSGTRVLLTLPTHPEDNHA